MKGVVISLLISLGLSVLDLAFSQNSELQIDGKIVLGASDQPNPVKGIIRWSGIDFEGWNGYEWISLTGGRTGSIEDIDGNVYPTTRIGDQIWMGVNLRTTKFKDGTSIPQASLSGPWSTTTDPAYSVYGLNTSLIPDYGLLYNFYDATDPKGVCPEGWRVPQLADWTELTTFLVDRTAGKLKEKGTQFREDPNEGATNDYYFNARGAGTRNSFDHFLSLKGVAIFWMNKTELGDLFVCQILHVLKIIF